MVQYNIDSISQQINIKYQRIKLKKRPYLAFKINNMIKLNTTYPVILPMYIHGEV